MVYSWCRRCGLQAEDAADMVQDVFLVVIDAIGGFRGGRTGAFRAWLRIITQNRIRDRFRQTAGQPAATGGSAAFERLQQLPDTIAPAEEGSTDDSDEDVWQYAIEHVRAGFPTHVWDAFWRVTVDAVPTKDVAAELGMSLAAVYQARSRVLRRLREDLRDLDDRE
jgi:RNA polymerase sigma-70 factor (ECF subfamily)